MKRTVFSAVLIVSLLYINLPAQVSSQKQNLLDVMSSTPPISVTIGGEFIVTGSFPAYSGERLDQFVTRIYNEVKNSLPFPTNNEQLFMKFISKTDKFALRGIKLVRKDGTKLDIDLLKFRLTGNFDNNPYLKNDDVVIFPEYNLDYGFIDINGAVNKPTKFQFVEGDKLEDAIFFARGINKAYEDVNTAVISRLSYDGKSEEKITVNLEDEFYLKRGDRIKIAADQTNRKAYKVLVLGEVNQPGYIYVTKDNTTLKDVIEKAGGFTENASLKDAQLVRNLNREQILKKYAIEEKAKEDPSELIIDEENNYWQLLETLRMFRSADLLDEDTLFFSLDNQLRILEGNNLVDFTRLDSADSATSDFIVKDGDVVIVPERFEAVYVFGQVGTIGYYKYIKGMGYDYYIQQAGGLTGTAKSDDDIFIIKGTSREWISISEDNYDIEPGDYIYVMKEIPRNIWYYVQRIGTIAGILGSIATLILLFRY
ncbi:MAG TPA: hypothetical protein ENN33_00520 [Ignavibacteria bacterium]|nr:hypothetical protein [Ignavibacteria bacterium]